MTDQSEEEGDCCADDWSVWLNFETPVWAVLPFVQFSMVVFLLLHGRKEKTFRQAFFVFFGVVTVVDCVLVLMRPLRDTGGTIFGTQYDFGYTTEEVNGTKEYYPTVMARINDILRYVAVPVVLHAQPLFLTAIAANRFTAFCFPLRHVSIWRQRTVIVVMVALAAISVLLGVTYPAAIMIIQAVKCSSGTNIQQEDLRCDLFYSWPFSSLNALIPLSLLIVNSAICCLISFSLNVGSVTMLVVHRVLGKLQQKGPELRLFVHSLYIFVLQMMLAFQDLVWVADNAGSIADSLAIKGFSWDYFLHSSEWLAGLKATRKFGDGYCWIVPGCKTAKDDWSSERPRLPVCSVWYRFLTGDLRLREHPDFTLRMLATCMLALSGSISLLIISSNVRNAYFRFYFRCNFLTKKPQQLTGIRVVKVATARRAPSQTVQASSS